MARPLFSTDRAARESMKTVRTAMVRYSRAHAKEPLNAFFTAPAAASLAINDVLTTGAMCPESRELLAATWRLQSDDGSWHYPTDDMVPYLERQQKYVAYFIAVGVGYLPPEYVAGEAARLGIQKLIGFVRANMPGNAHDQAVVLWASARTKGLLTTEEVESYKALLLRLQRPDGGWTLPSFGRWLRHDGPPNDPGGSSDGYATGLVLTALCASGYDSTDARIVQGLSWIESHQRSSGRWFTRSTYSDNLQGYLTTMATAYALMGIKLCRVGSRNWIGESIH